MCPGCGAEASLEADNPARPFCSSRCKLLDLGAWAAGRYVIPGPELTPRDDDDADTGH